MITSRSRALHRISKELNTLISSPIDGFELLPNPLLPTLTIQGFLIGPQSTPYSNGLFSFSVTFPEEYPFRPPVFLFNTLIIHPKVLHNQACLPILQSRWTPQLTLGEVLKEVRKMLEKPDFEDYVDSVVVERYRKGTFEVEAEEATLTYAH